MDEASSIPGRTKLGFRDYVLAGLAALLPLWLTIYIVWFLVKLTGNLVFPALRPFFARLLREPPPDQLLLALSALIVCFVIWGTGYLIIHVMGHGHISRIESLITRVPVARSIHSIIRRLVDVLVNSRASFRSVVRVEFPVAGVYAIGFVTSEDVVGEGGAQLVTVMVPTVPNPTSGFLLFVPKDKLQFLPMPVDEAVTLILSIGTLGPRGFAPIAPPEGPYPAGGTKKYTGGI